MVLYVLDVFLLVFLGHLNIRSIRFEIYGNMFSETILNSRECFVNDVCDVVFAIPKSVLVKRKLHLNSQHPGHATMKLCINALQI